MKTYTKEEIANILDLHAKWSNGVDGGVKADLSGSDLSGSDLRTSNLRTSNLLGSKLRIQTFGFRPSGFKNRQKIYPNFLYWFKKTNDYLLF